MLGVAPPPALICLDPGHGTPPAVGRQVEPIGPGSSQLKIKDGGGARGEAPVALAIAWRTRSELLRRGYRVAMTRTGPTFRVGTGGNIARAQFCNRRHAALMLRIHADGSASPASHGVRRSIPALHRGWTDDIYARSRRAAALVQRAVLGATGAADLRPRPALRPDRLQLGGRAGDARRDRLHDQPARGRRSCDRPPTSGASPVGLAAGVAAAVGSEKKR